MCSTFSIATRVVVAGGLLIAVALTVHAQKKFAHSGEAHFQINLGGKRLPNWTGGFLIPIEGNGTAKPSLTFIDDTGLQRRSTSFTIPDATAIVIDGVARHSDGTYAVCGRAFNGAGKGGGFVSWLSSDGENVATMQTFPYVPYHITIAPDGTTWTMGVEIANGTEFDRAVNQDHGVIRRFSASHQLIGSFIPRRGLRDFDFDMGQGYLASANGRVGWYLDAVHTYFELDYDREKVSDPISFPGIGKHGDTKWYATGLAVMDNGDIYLSASHASWERPPVPDIYRLERSTRSWQPVELPKSGNGKPLALVILGGDGKRLALLGSLQSVIFMLPTE